MRPTVTASGAGRESCAYLVIALGTAAAVLPVLSEIYTTNGRPSIPPGWATIALALAAGLVGLDHFFGFSSGWMRYRDTELQLTRLRHQFGYAWQEALHGPPRRHRVTT